MAVAEAPVRECGGNPSCPPWVLHCTHVGRKMSLLSDLRLLPVRDCVECLRPDSPLRYSIWELRDSWITCHECGVPAIYVHQIISGSRFHGYDAALAVFRARKTLLEPLP